MPPRRIVAWVSHRVPANARLLFRFLPSLYGCSTNYSGLHRCGDAAERQADVSPVWGEVLPSRPRGQRRIVADQATVRVEIDCMPRAFAGQVGRRP